YTTWLLGRERALELTPSFEFERVISWGEETGEARGFLERGRHFDLSGARDLRPILQRTARGGVLTGAELRHVHDTIQASDVARRTLLQGKADLPILTSLAKRMPDLQELQQTIAHAIDHLGEVRDGASPMLHALRQQAAEAYHRLEQTLQRIMRSSLGRRILQEPYITERNGRLVLPVQTPMKSHLPGLVHDVSDTGATVFVEPLATVTLGNHWRELKAAEEHETERILKDLSQQLDAAAEECLLLLDLLAHLDLVMAKARYALAVSAVPAATSQTKPSFVRLVEARHPLLKEPVVPISLELGLGATQTAASEDSWTVLLITGPNAGGKTVALKTVGLLALMHQAGLQVPASEGTALPVFDGVFADIGDQQSLERSLSTFSSHITAIRAILQEATSRSLVLLDELGSSTDPEEGAALAKAILFHFLQSGALLVATTHQREVAAYVQKTPGMSNASVELNQVTLAPTYRLTLGLPGRSYALGIASRLGLAKSVIEHARSLLDPASRQVESLLTQVEQERLLAEEKRREAEDAFSEAERLRQELAMRLEEWTEHEASMKAEARRELEARVDEFLKRLKSTERALLALPGPSATGTGQGSLHQAKASVTRLRHELRSPDWKPPPQERNQWHQHLQPGDRVRVRGFIHDAEVLSSPDPRGNLEVRVGALRARVHQDQLERPLAGTSIPPTPLTTTASPPGASQAAIPPMNTELDVRGIRADEALRRLEAFLDRALLRGIISIRIIHGAGTGVLRRVVREKLEGHPLVKSWAPEGQPGDGATIVTLS
ncbi:MAG: endonuclease MutS2, partial [Chloroflexi bacterium]|nr:endonuclease MutS2 [Chloroflexota bacterium]